MHPRLPLTCVAFVGVKLHHRGALRAGAGVATRPEETEVAAHILTGVGYWTVVVSVTTPSQRDAAVVIAGEVSGGIAGHFIWERGRHMKVVIVEHNLAPPKSQKNGLPEPENGNSIHASVCLERIRLEGMRSTDGRGVEESCSEPSLTHTMLRVKDSAV
ncbi:hypothetical protein EYF80_025379 [Liparis tanakae]|uniref:Uncharacterized protein n=1 Tax=Liparis tanakae TaxID=230148 RepID=A0A4Z2HF15_9TELE|nr:hypothetical protein EYF80_025379 [Liparis tanakae]